MCQVILILQIYIQMNLVCFSVLACYTSGAEVRTLLVYTFPIYNLRTNKSLSDII